MVDPRLVLTVLSAGAELFAFYRLFAVRAHRSYPWFATYLLTGCAQSFIWLGGSPESHGYLTLYRWTMPVMLGLQCMVVLELWRKLMSCYRGIHQISHSLGIIIITVALAVSFSSGFDGLAMSGRPLRIVTFHWLMWGVRYTASVLCIASVILAFWSHLFDHGVPENTIRHGQLLSTYFGLLAMGYLVVNVAPGSAPFIGACMTGAAAGCYVLWGVVIKRKGQEPIERLLIPDRAVLKALPVTFRRLLPY
jgi:hypothetical protein